MSANTTTLDQPDLKYDTPTILLHWLTAALIVLLWGGSKLIDAFGPAAVGPLRSLHVTLGLTLGVVFLVRLAWRITRGRSLPEAGHGWPEIAARAVHYVLYILIGSTVALGVSYAWLRGVDVWGFAFPGGDRALARTLRGYHELAANAVLFLALAHAAAALFHHYVLRDGVLRRMLPRG